MRLNKWWRNSHRKSTTRKAGRLRTARVPILEQLEDRTVPSNVVGSLTTDGLPATASVEAFSWGVSNSNGRPVPANFTVTVEPGIDSPGFGAGGGVRSVTAVSFTYCIQAFAIASFGSHTAWSGLPANFAAGTASPRGRGASHAGAVGMAWIPSPSRWKTCGWAATARCGPGS